MTYPDDVLKAAREAAAMHEEQLAAKAPGTSISYWYHFKASNYRSGSYDNSEKVSCACIAIMAERERVKGHHMRDAPEGE